MLQELWTLLELQLQSINSDQFRNVYILAYFIAQGFFKNMMSSLLEFVSGIICFSWLAAPDVCHQNASENSIHCSIESSGGAEL
jgi:hypothetical protein